MLASLKAFVSSGPTFPYTIGQPFASAWGGWTHYRGTAKDDNSAVSIFKISAPSTTDPKLRAARNGVKRLKLVKHPNILAFKDSQEVEEKGETVIYLVTEAVTPLVNVLQTLDFTPEARKEYVAMGMYHIAKAVAFLNSDCKLVGAQYKPGEVGKSEWAAIQQSPPWAVDAWGVGCLMQEAFSAKELMRTEDLRNTDPIPSPLLQDYQRLLASAPTRRLNPAKLAESSVLKNKLVDTIAFLENLAVKDSAEKDAFFKRLPSQIPSMPIPVAQRMLLPMLASALEFGGAPAATVSALLQIAKSLPPDDFTKSVVPCLARLFTSNDRSVRRMLLESIDSYGPHLTSAVVDEQIYPAVQGGFTDSNAYLRELTLKSMLVMAPKLSQRTLNQSLLKHLAKLQVDEEPPIRANTTILLGNLAPHLSEATCKRVLLNAFTRALKDSFPPARAAGVRAIIATARLHSMEEVAQRVIPAMSPLALDSVGEVRQCALMALDTFVKSLKEHGAKLEAAAPAGATVSKEAVQAGSSWGNLTWSAMSSIGLARSKDATSAEPSAPGPAERAGSLSAQPVQASPAPGHPPPSAPSSVGMGGGSSATPSVDGWDDEDDFEVEDREETAARERLSRMNVRPASSSRPAGSTGGSTASGQRPGSTSLETSSFFDDVDNDKWEDMDAPGNTARPSPAPGRSMQAAREGLQADGAAWAQPGVEERGGLKLGATKTGAAVNKLTEDNFEW